MEFYFDHLGIPHEIVDTEGMLDPRRCGVCGHVHDSAKQKTVARYSDCDMWRCPKCKSLQDNRDWMTGPGHARRVE